MTGFDPTMITASAASAAGEGARSSVMSFMRGHVLQHTADVDSWNVPFAHWWILDIFRSDAFVIFFAVFLLLALFGFGFRRDRLVQNRLGSFLEVLVQFIRDHIAIESLGREHGVQLTPLFCTQFFFILAMNLLGLLPVFTCPTGNLNVTTGLAVVTALVLIIGSIRILGLRGFLGTFVIRGIPLPLTILMIPLEVVSLFSRIAALTIRLFANMLAGHIMIFAMLGMVVIFGWVAFPAVLITVGVYFFELFVAFFQAYIFTLLSAVFISQAWQPQH